VKRKVKRKGRANEKRASQPTADETASSWLSFRELPIISNKSNSTPAESQVLARSSLAQTRHRVILSDEKQKLFQPCSKPRVECMRQIPKDLILNPLRRPTNNVGSGSLGVLEYIGRWRLIK